MTRVVL
jgi:hypothetical protein